MRNQAVSARPPLDRELHLFDDPTAALQLEEMRDSLAAQLPRLSVRDRVFIVLHYCEQLSLRDLGRLLGVSDSRCGQIRKEVIQALSTPSGTELPSSTR